jgi:hypothetical protein
MSFKAKDGGRLWVLVLITLAFGIPLIGRAGASDDWLVWAFWIVWPLLLFTSFVLFGFKHHGLAWLGLISALLSGLIALMPVLAE